MKKVKLNENVNDQTVLVKIEPFVVYRMDDYTWIAAETEEQAIDYYMDLCGLVDRQEIYDNMVRCDINDPESMWWVIYEFPKDDNFTQFEENDETYYKGIRYGYWEGEPAKMISYVEAHKLYKDEKFPYVIASCN